MLFVIALKRIASLYVAVFCMCFTTGCNALRFNKSDLAEYVTRSPTDVRLSEKARRINSRGLRDLEKGDLAEAEEKFREALEIDISFGPAHNNLGQLYLTRHQLYLAAWEFEYCANLMPERTEPVINQGLAYEMAGRLELAETFYRQAHEMQATNPFAISSLLRIRIRQDADAAEIRFLLDELILHDDRQAWVEWAKTLRATQYRDDAAACAQCEDGAVMPLDATHDQLFQADDGLSLTQPNQSQVTPLEPAEMSVPTPDVPSEDFLLPGPILPVPETIPNQWLEATEIQDFSASRRSRPTRLPPALATDQPIMKAGFVMPKLSPETSAASNSRVLQSAYKSSEPTK